MDTLHVPDTVPVITLADTVLFPQALLPLHIFEPRYRQMLDDVLAKNRMFAVAHLDATRLRDPRLIEPLHHTAAVGIIRACQNGENGTANLLLQGICRVRVKKIIREEPYRVITVQPLTTTAGTHHAELEVLRLEVMRLLHLRRRLGTPAPKGMTQFLESIEDVDTFADIAVFNLCENSAIKQQLLEALETRHRLQLFAASLKSEIEAQRLRRKLQGRLPDDQIAGN